VAPATSIERTPAVRDRAQTEARILGAVGVVLARDGFGGLGVNAVAREAGVDKVLIYRYWGGLEELLRAWAGSGRFWPGVDELLAAQPGLLALPFAERYARFFSHFIATLRARPLTLEILASEVVERNALTAVLESERERWGDEATRVLGGSEFASRDALRGITILLVSGVQYLLIRARKIRIFGGIDITSDAGWRELEAAVRTMAEALFPPPELPAPKPATRRKR